MSFPSRLLDGYSAFVASRLPQERERYQTLAEIGQRPETMVICCCDSRVAPEVIFDSHPGEIFVLRNIANLVPPYNPTGLTHGVSAALEFAVRILKVKYVMVMGHSHCGGVRAFVEHRGRPKVGDFIDNWISLIAPAAESLEAGGNHGGGDYFGRLEQASVVAALGNLMTFPDIRQRVSERDLHLVGAYFDVATGALSIYDAKAAAFAPIKVGASPQPAAAR
jgi:carbonic anhydrase